MPLADGNRAETVALAAALGFLGTYVTMELFELPRPLLLAGQVPMRFPGLLLVSAVAAALAAGVVRVLDLGASTRARIVLHGMTLVTFFGGLAVLGWLQWR